MSESSNPDSAAKSVEQEAGTTCTCGNSSNSSSTNNSKSRKLITLVLGAGVSKGLVPTWDDFTKNVLRSVDQRLGGGSNLFSSMRGKLTDVPNGNGILLEIAWRALYDFRINTNSVAEPPTDGEDNKFKTTISDISNLENSLEIEWSNILRDALYDQSWGNSLAPTESLKTIIELLTSDDVSCIDQVITFNADDWLEYFIYMQMSACNIGPSSKQDFHDRFQLVTQPTHGANPTLSKAGKRKITLSHIHGFLCHSTETTNPTYIGKLPPEDRNPAYDAPNMLVFRDSDYWNTASQPSSFAHYTLLSALARISHQGCMAGSDGVELLLRRNDLSHQRPKEPCPHSVPCRSSNWNGIIHVEWR